MSLSENIYMYIFSASQNTRGGEYICLTISLSLWGNLNDIIVTIIKGMLKLVVMKYPYHFQVIFLNKRTNSCVVLESFKMKIKWTLCLY